MNRETERLLKELHEKYSGKHREYKIANTDFLLSFFSNGDETRVLFYRGINPRSTPNKNSTKLMLEARNGRVIYERDMGPVFSPIYALTLYSAQFGELARKILDRKDDPALLEKTLDLLFS